MEKQFLYEHEMKEVFLKGYKKRPALLKYQLECKAREGGIDLLTIELVKGDINICAFEFKLNDIKKALTQAAANVPFCSKSFIVVPIDKRRLIQDKYLSFLKNERYIGVIGLATTGKWEIVYQPKTQPLESIRIKNEILKVMLDVL